MRKWLCTIRGWFRLPTAYALDLKQSEQMGCPVFVKEKILSREEEQRKKYEEIAAEVEAAAKLTEKKALEERDFQLFKFKERHDNDVATYTFSCSRWGDFLSLQIERKGKKLATALNLGETQEMRFIPGFEPDLNGVLTYHSSVSTNAEGVRSVTIRADSIDRHWESPYSPSYGGAGYPMVKLDPEQGKGGSVIASWGGDDFPVRLQTPGYARDAHDDQIRFERIRATLFVPAGLGQQVYQAILSSMDLNGAPVAIKGKQG